MICPDCGAAAEEGISVCPNCGTALTEPVPAPAEPAGPVAEPGSASTAAEPTESPIESPVFLGEPAEPFNAPPPPTDEEPPAQIEPPTPPVRKKGLIIGGIVAAAAVVVLAAVLVLPGLLGGGSAKDQLARCMSGTMGAYTDYLDNSPLSAVLKQSQAGAARDTLTFRLGDQIGQLLQSTSGLPLTAQQLADTGFTLTQERNLSQRQLAADFSLDMGTDRLTSVQFFLEDALLSLTSPELTGGTVYSLNTETLSSDWNASPFGVNSPMPEDFGFNLFDSRPADGSFTDGSPAPFVDTETTATLKSLYKTYSDAITVTKDGKSDVLVGENTISCTKYVMTVPAQALREYLSGVLHTLRDDDTFRSALWGAMVPTFPGMEDLYDGYEASWQEGFDSTSDTMDTLLSYLTEDVIIDFYTADNRVLRLEGSALMTEESGVTVRAGLVLQFGDGKYIENALSGELTTDSGDAVVNIAFSSAGSHRSEDGLFTDETRFTLTQNDYGPVGVAFATTYDSNRSADNFTFKLTPIDLSEVDMSFDVAGTVLMDAAAGSLSVDLPRIAFSVGGESIAVSGSYTLEPIDALSLTHEAPTPILSLTEEDFNELDLQLQNGLISVLYKLYGIS